MGGFFFGRAYFGRAYFGRVHFGMVILGMYIVEGILKGILDDIFLANGGPSEAKTVPTCIPCEL